MTKITRTARPDRSSSLNPAFPAVAGKRLSARRRRQRAEREPIFELTPLEKRVLLSSIQVVNYDFSGSTTGWSGGSVDETVGSYGGGQHYYSSKGASGPLTLTLTDIPAHSGLSVSFGVIAFDKWSGAVGDSRFTVTANGMGAPDVSLASGGSLPTGTTQYYVVTALNGTESMPSQEVSAEPTTSGTQSVTLSWGAVSGATSYNVYRALTAGGETLLGTSTTTSFTDDGSLTPGTITPPKDLVDTTFGNTWYVSTTDHSPTDAMMFAPGNYAPGAAGTVVTSYPHHDLDCDQCIPAVPGCFPIMNIADSEYNYSLPVGIVSSTVTLQFSGPSSASPDEYFGLTNVQVNIGQAQPCNCSTTGVSGFTGAPTTPVPGPSIDGGDGQDPGIDLTNGSAGSSLAGGGIAGTDTTLNGVATLVQDGDDTLVVNNGGSGMTWFDLVSTTWVERYGGTDTLTQDTTDHTYTLTDGSGMQTTFNDFTVSPSALQGRVASTTDADGNTTTYSYDSYGTLTGSVQSMTTGNVTTKTLEQYSYLPGSDPNAGELASITSLSKTYDMGLSESDSNTPYQPIEATDYTYWNTGDSGGTLGELQTASTADAGPAAPAPALASGGSLTAGTPLYYVITAITPLDETNASTEATITPTSGNGTVDLSWPAFAGATGYKIYRGTASGGETLLYTAGAVTSYSDTGASAGSAVPPVTYTGTTLYRWYVSGDSDTHGYPGAQKYVVGPESYARLAASLTSGTTPLTATDSQLAPYADDYYQYDADQRVTEQVVQGAGSSTAASPATGLGTYTYAYATSGNASGYNIWESKETETLPDGTVDTTYFDAEGETMLSVVTDGVTGLSQGTFTEYDDSGQAILVAQPAAVLLPASLSTLEQYPDLLNNTGTYGTTPSYQYLSNTAGQITITGYYGSSGVATADGTSTPSSGVSGAGGAPGYVEDTAVQQGQDGTPIPQDLETYYKRTCAGVTIYPIAQDTTYGSTGSGDPRTTSDFYTWYSGGDQMQSQTVVQPPIDGSQNGPASSDTDLADGDITDTWFDSFGRPEFVLDGNGSVSFTAYDPATGATVESITSVNYSDLTSAQKTLFDATGWSDPSGLNLVTTTAVDAQGRTIEITSPNGNVTYTVYNDPDHEVRTYPGFDISTGAITGPIQISETYYPAPNASSGQQTLYSETLTSSATPALNGAGTPDGAESLTAGNVQSLSRDLTNSAGQTIETDAYYSMAEVTWSDAAAQLGLPSADSSCDNYHATLYSFDAGGRQDSVTTPDGTITQTDFDGLGNPLSKWVGTSSDNLVDVEDDYYDTQTAPTPAVTSGATSGGSLSATTYYVRLTYITPSGETAGSIEATQAVSGSHLLAVTSPASASSATAYNVYVSMSPGTETLQNSTPYAIGTDWTEPTTGLVSGAAVPVNGNGDGNLTEVVDHPGAGEPDRIILSYFDWQDRLVATKQGAQASEDTTTYRPITYYVLDNAGEATETDTYDGDTVWIATPTTGGDAGIPQPPSSTLESKSTAVYDDQGRAFQTTVYDIEAGSDTTGSTLVTNGYFDHDGNLIATYAPGGLVAKQFYDGADRVIETFQTDGGAVDNSGVPLTGWSNAGSVNNDVVLNQTDNTYDADGNLIEVENRDRFDNDAPTDTAGLCCTSSSPKLRNSYVATYYDAADRVTAEENVGTNGGSSPWSRPSTPDSSSATALVTTTAYNAQGLPSEVTDPSGIVDLTEYDLLGRTTTSIDNYLPSVNSGQPYGSADNQTTTYTYNGNGDVLTQTAVMPSGTNNQTTGYVYAITISGGSGLNSNDLLATTELPSPSTGAASSLAANDTSTTYDALGDAVTTTDQNSTVHALSYNVLGQETSDSVTLAEGSTVDDSVLTHTYTYNGLGLPFVQTSYSPSMSVVNTVEDLYNGYGQLTAQYQSHGSGAIATSGPTPTPATKYSYDESSSDNDDRITEMTYPNGRILEYGYDGNALDDAISRVDYLADAGGSGTGHLVNYTYLGLSTIVDQADSNGDSLSYIQRSGDDDAITTGDDAGGDRYTGLDRFGRVIDQNWLNTCGGITTFDRFQYTYDLDGNVLSENNLVNSGNSELFQANATSGTPDPGYDGLNRLTNFERGTLSASGYNGSTLDQITSPSPSATQTWTLDQLGNQTSVSTGGTPVSNTTNSRNELTENGSNSLAQDDNGNTTTDQAGNTYIYDAWNHIISVKNASDTTIAVYTYDANGSRISEDASGTTTDYYYNGSQIIEQRQSGTVTSQNVFNIDYVNDLLLRDDNSTTGSLGASSSGLGERLFAQHDANFDVTALVSAGGEVVQRFVYSPYGTVTVLSPSWGSTTDAFNWGYLYQGMWQDPATGLYYTPNRDYNAPLDRWMQADPAGYVDGGSLYEADADAPSSLTDPAGLDKTIVSIPAILARNATQNQRATTIVPAAKLNVDYTFDSKAGTFSVDSAVIGDNDYKDIGTVPFAFGSTTWKTGPQVAGQIFSITNVKQEAPVQQLEIDLYLQTRYTPANTTTQPVTGTTPAASCVRINYRLVALQKMSATATVTATIVRWNKSANGSVILGDAQQASENLSSKEAYASDPGYSDGLKSNAPLVVTSGIFDLGSEPTGEWKDYGSPMVFSYNFATSQIGAPTGKINYTPPLKRIG